MRTADAWFDEYGQSHRNATNKLLHWICVPVIVLTVFGFLWAIPVPDVLRARSPWLNLGTLAAAAAVVYYAFLSLRLALAMLPLLVVMLLIVQWLDSLTIPLWLSCLVLFTIAWIGQFVGHAVEGARPSFFKDLQFLLIGPLWLLGHVFRRAGISY
jgi:uncharacterized membrane protein YGL010W